MFWYNIIINTPGQIWEKKDCTEFKAPSRIDFIKMIAKIGPLRQFFSPLFSFFWLVPGFVEGD
jgi:hypothetical protein